VVLEALEKGEREGAAHKAVVDDLPLFRAAPVAAAVKPVARASEVEARLKDVLPDELSAREALQLVYELKELLRGPEA